MYVDLAGFSDVPPKRRDRTREGDVYRGLKEVLVGMLAKELAANPEFVADVLPDGRELFLKLAEVYRAAVREELNLKLSWDRDREMAKALMVDGGKRAPQPRRGIASAIAAALGQTRWTKYDNVRLKRRPPPIIE